MDEKENVEAPAGCGKERMGNMGMMGTMCLAEPNEKREYPILNDE